MSGFQPVQMPDFGATWQRGQAFADQREQNALARMMQMRQFEQQQQFENVLAKPGITQGLMNNDPQALAALGQFGGPQGFQMVLPLIKQQREDAMVQSALAGLGMGGGAAPSAPAAPTSGGVPPVQASPLPPAAPAGPAGPVQPAVAGVDRRESNRRLAALRDAVMNDPNLTPEQQQAALARISEMATREAGMPVGPVYRANAGTGGVFAGLPAPSGQVAGPAAAPATPAAPVAPGGAASRMPTLAQVNAMIASGNERLRKIGEAYLPIVTRDPSYSVVNVGGTAYQMDSRSGTMRPLGTAQDPNGPVPSGYTRQPDGSLARAPGGPDENADRREGFTQARQLREEVTNLTKDFRIIQTAHGALTEVARDPTPAGDLSLLYQFNKMLDPNSVVRESEFATAARTGSLDQRIGASVLRVLNGERLTADQRADFVRQADLLYQSQRRGYDQIVNQYRGLAERARLPVDQVIVDQITPQPAAPARPPPPPAVIQSAQQALTAARGQLGPGASDDAVVARARELMGR
jgi:hypothetical protein